jgi:hypothetical protein
VVSDTRGAVNDVSANGAPDGASTEVPAADDARSAVTSVAGGRAALRRAAASRKEITLPTLTGRGGLVVMFGATGLGALLGNHTFQGMLFCAACVVAAVTTRKSDLLTVVVSPPAIFFTVSLIAAVLGGLGDHSFLVSVLVSVGTTLTEGAPWLFLGTLLMVAIALPRGLLKNLAELRVRVAADNPFKLTDSRLRRRAEDPVQWDEDVSPRRRR